MEEKIEQPVVEAKEKLPKKLEEIVKAVESLTVLELADLVKAFEARFGVSATPVAIPAGGEAQPTAGLVEKATFDVILAEVGPDKIKVIKEIRAITNLGLKEAKDLVDTAPKPIKTNVSKEEAQNIKKQIEAVGAKVELK